jgi:hypothetical protein
MKLYSYCLRYDDGGAPNPYWGVCTLAICKPAIRRAAKVGDWIAGTGSKNSAVGDISKSLVYAMRVTQVLSMPEYDSFCRVSLPGKIPDWTSSEFSRKMGDCIYDFSYPGKPKIRPSIHAEGNRERDLSGLCVLLSKHFYYLGDEPLQLPKSLLPIIQPTRGHKSHANAPYVHQFVDWIESQKKSQNRLLGQPQLKSKIMLLSPEGCRTVCSQRDTQDADGDRLC